jgi:hypothetical protein
MMTVTLRNDFHKTAVNVHINSFPATLTPSQTKRVYRTLCGITGCTCGGVRGLQSHNGIMLFAANDYAWGLDSEDGRTRLHIESAEEAE